MVLNRRPTQSLIGFAVVGHLPATTPVGVDDLKRAFGSVYHAISPTIKAMLPSTIAITVPVFSTTRSTLEAAGP